MGRTSDSCIASSSSATHEAARSAFSVSTVEEDIFERVLEEMSREATLRGKWEGTGKAMCNALYDVYWQRVTWLHEPRLRAGVLNHLEDESKNMAVMQ